MAVLTKARFTWNSNNLSTYVRSIDAPIARDTVDGSAMGDNAHVMETALQTWSVTIEFLDPDVASGPVATLWADFDAGTSRTLTYRASTAAKSTTNPEYSGSAVIVSMSPVSGGVGDLRSMSVEFQSAGALSRSTS